MTSRHKFDVYYLRTELVQEKRELLRTAEGRNTALNGEIIGVCIIIIIIYIVSSLLLLEILNELACFMNVIFGHDKNVG